jgi:hypothetical protein
MLPDESAAMALGRRSQDRVAGRLFPVPSPATTETAAPEERHGHDNDPMRAQQMPRLASRERPCVKHENMLEMI